MFGATICALGGAGIGAKSGLTYSGFLRLEDALMTTIRLFSLSVLLLAWVGVAQAQLPDSSRDGLNRLTDSQTPVACGPGTDKKDPP